MVKNIIPENGIPESLDPNKESDVLGGRRIEGEKINKGKVEIREDASSRLDELKANIDHKKDSLDTIFASEAKNQKLLPHNITRKKEQGSAFAPIFTRHDSDIGKGPVRAFFDSMVVFGGVIGDLGKDTAEVVFHPIDTTRNTIALLEEESSAKII